MSDLTILFKGPVEADAVELEWDPAAAPISAEAQAYIDQRWEAYVADARTHGGSLFNGAITRLIRTEPRQNQPGVKLIVGPTDYKTFVVTVIRDRDWFQAHAPEAMTFGLGNSVLMTRGNRALLGVRSPKTIAYGGRAHVIGGVLELLGTQGLDATLQGVLMHLRREIEEEASVKQSDLIGSPVLLALVRDAFLAQPELIWQWELALELEEVATRLDAHEHHGAVIVEKNTIPSATWQQMTPVARAAWEHWRKR